MNATEKLGIGRFETSEELARELESKNKAEIAARVREISRNQASAQSIELRNRLREELNWQEQREIREALAWTWVERVFDKDMSAEEKAIAEVWAIIPGWEEAAQNIWKMEKWWKSMSESFDTAWGLLKEGKFMAAIAVFFKWLFWKFSLDEWNKKPGEENESNWSNESLEWNVNIKYQYASSAVSSIFWWEHKNTLNKLFSLDKFQTMTYSQTKDLYEKYKWKSDKSGIEQEVWIIWVSPIEVFNALWVIVNEEWKSWKLLSNFYEKKWEEIWNKTIKECVSWLYTNIKMFKNIENITTPDQIIEAWKNFALKIEYNENWEAKISWEIYESLKELWITQNIILFVNSRTWFEDIVNLEKNLDWIKSELNDKDKKILNDKFIPFAKNIEWTLADTFGHKYSSEIKSCFSWEHLKPKELLEIYAMSWWNSDWEKLNDMQKTYIYTKLINLIDDRNPKLAWAYGTYIAKEWKTILPSWVLDMLTYLWEKLKNWASKIWQNLLWAAEENPIIAWITALTIYFWPWFSSKESIDIKIKRIFK